MFRALRAQHQEVKIVMYSILYHHTETRFCALSWLITEKKIDGLNKMWCHTDGIRMEGI